MTWSCLLYTSNEIGYFEFDEVPVGIWIVREIAAPQAFILSEEAFQVEITEVAETIEITIQNQISKGTVETIKVDADYPDHKLSGAIFEVYADVDNEDVYKRQVIREHYEKGASKAMEKTRTLAFQVDEDLFQKV